MNGEGSSVRAPRYVHLMKGSNGYGFNLHGEKGVVGQYISAVDKGGPADIAGLCVGDRVVEANGVNVEAATHAQVVAKIKEDPERATLLVVDRVTDEYMKREGLPIAGDFAKYDCVADLVRARQTELANNAHHPGDNNNDPTKPVVAINDVYVQDKSLENNIERTTEFTEVGTPSISPQVPEESSQLNNHYNSSSSVIDEDPAERQAVGNGVPTSSEETRASMAAALPKPKRRVIKEEKTDNWAAKAALFNNL